MIKRRMIAVLLSAAVLSAPVPAFSHHGEPLYRIKFYSDSSYTQQVGEDWGFCASFGVRYSHTGQATDHALYQLEGYCIDGEYEMF
jgi:hypothetical protein